TGCTSTPESVVKSTSRFREASYRSCQRRRPASMSSTEKIVGRPTNRGHPNETARLLHRLGRRLLLEVAGLGAHLPQRRERALPGPLVERADAEVDGHEVAGAGLSHLAAVRRDRGQRAAPVPRV